MTPQLAKKLDKGTWTLGGCSIEIPTAMWRCNHCGIDIYHERDRLLMENHD